MIGSFDELFIENEKPEVIPDVLVKALNKLLPEGFEYKVSGDKCLLVPTSIEELKRLELDVKYEVPKEVAMNQDKLMDYLYRTQTQLPITDAKILLDNNEYMPIDLIKFPFGPVDLKKFTGYITPPAFPGAFPIEFIIDDYYHYEIKFRREPYADFNIIKLQNESLKSICIVILMHEDSSECNFTIKLITDIKTEVVDIISGINIFRGLINGTAKINGFDLNQKLVTENKIDWIPDALEFLSKLKELEERLQISFKLQMKDFDDSDLNLVSELYQGLVKREAKVLINAFDHIVVGEMKYTKSESIIGKSNVNFEFVEEFSYNLFEKEFKVFCASILEGFIISKKRKLKDGRIKLYLVNDKESDIKFTRRYFRTAVEAKEELSKRHR